MRYDVTHPNGIVHVVEADGEPEAREAVLELLHEDAACDPDELEVAESEEQGG